MSEIDRATLDRMTAALDPFHTLSGRIASQYAALEHAVDQTIWRLAGLEPALGACITGQLTSTSARLRVVLSLLNLKDGSDALVKRVNAFVRRNYEIADLRNRAVHDVWTVTSELKIAQLRITIEKDRLVIGPKVFSLEDMNGTLKKVSGQMQAMVALHHDIVAWLASSPQKWREPLQELSLGQLADVSPQN